MIIDKIIYWNTHETVLFAVEELRRLMRGAGVESTIGDSTSFDEPVGKDTNRVILLTTSDYHSLVNEKKRITVNDDGFALLRSGNDLWIVGNEPRSILYGVYRYCRNQFGYQWIELDKETLVKEASSKDGDLYIHEPMFARRGNIIETINDPSYINSLIDWGVKNGQNEYFFTFFLWDEIKRYVTSTLGKRGVHVTLGGHSLSYLLKYIQQDTRGSLPGQDEKLKFFAENTALQDKVIDKIVSICLETKVITRISLWPEDIGIDEKNASDFLPTYIRFNEKLKEALEEQDVHVEVEYIVYNAGLSWNMLEREEQTAASNQVDALYAYWGRDYSTAIDSSDPRQVRAYQSLKDWNAQTRKRGRSLTVLEYYSDHFMLSELFPPLLTRIQQDLHDYKQLNVNGVLNLIVPTHQKEPDIEARYPWKWIHHFNNYMYARIAWGEKYEVIAQEYFSIFNEDQTVFQEILTELEKLVSQHTKWNAPLFPARVVDPEKVHGQVKDLTISSYLREVHDYLSTYDLTEIEPLMAIQTKDNQAAFTAKEMMLIYFYYLKKVAGIHSKTWELKVGNSNGRSGGFENEF